MRRRTSYIPQPVQVKALREETGAGMLDCKRKVSDCLVN